MAPTVLVVEDDAMVADMTCRMVRVAGYHSECAGTGKEALALIDNPRITLDGLIVDFTLPDMPGTQVARMARLRRPSLPVIFISGYPNYREVPPEFDAAPFLLKPYELAELTAVLHRILPPSGGSE